MARKPKQIVTDEDGTPVEAADPVGVQEIEWTEEDSTPHIDEEPLPVSGRKVRWTLKGEQAGAFSEHGQHIEGEEVTSVHADKLVEMGFAEETN